MPRTERIDAATAGNTWDAYRPVGARGAGWLVVLGVHAAFLALWISQRDHRVKLPTNVLMQLMLLQPHAPPPPRPAAQKETVRKPNMRQLPPPVEDRPIQMPPTPVNAPQAQLHVQTEEWLQPEAAPGAARARRVPSDYADLVKARVVAKVVYPANAVYPTPKGFKGDPRELMRQCTIPYEVVVDRQGMIVSYEIERCKDELLDAAAEAAVLKAQPFPPPPEGAEHYSVYGSINFTKPRLNRSTDSRP